MVTAIRTQNAAPPTPRTEEEQFNRVGRRNFGRIPAVMPMPNLIQIQIDSFNWFLNIGLRELFEEISPITDFTGKNMELEFKDYTFGEPRYSVYECRQRDMTYAAPLRVRVQLKIKETLTLKPADFRIQVRPRTSRAVVTPAPEGAGFLSWCLGSDGRGYEQVTCGNVPLGAYAAKEPNPIIDMKGPDVFKFAVDIFIRQAQEVTAAAGISLDEIDLWVPHQANFRIIDAAARRIGLPLDKVAINIDQFGNTSSASIPLALEDAVRNGRVHSGDHVLLAGFGSGLTWGATLLKWA